MERANEILAGLPAASAVFALRGDGEPYAAKTGNLRRRLERLLVEPQPGSKQLNLRAQTRSIEYTLTGSDFENRFLLYKVLRELFPKDYRDRLKLRPAPLIRLNLDNEYARAFVTR